MEYSFYRPDDVKTKEDLERWRRTHESKYVPACTSRTGIFESLPEDPISVIKLGFPPKLSKEEFQLRCIPADLPLVAMAEVCWFVQSTRTDYAYETNGSVDKQGVEVSAELYRKHHWSEFPEWYDLVSQVAERYNITGDCFNELRVISCHMFSRRRLGEPFKVLLSSSTEQRAIWVNVQYQLPVFSNICPFVEDVSPVKALEVGEKCCMNCKKVTTSSCANCRKVPYCSKQCQKKDYQRHKKVCQKNMQIYPLKNCMESLQNKTFKGISYEHACYLLDNSS